MSKVAETLIKIDIKIRIAVAAVVLVGTAVGYFFLIFAPVGDQISVSKTKVSSLETELVEKRGIVAHLPTYEKEVRRLDIELKKALSALPDQKGLEQLLSRISDKARDSGLEIQLFKPKAELLKEFYAEVPLELTVSGTFHQVATFFDEVGHLERVVNINDFQMSSPQIKDRDIYLTTKATATSFRFLDEKERSGADGKKKKKKKKKA